MRITRGTTDLHRPGGIAVAALAALLLAGCTAGSAGSGPTPAPTSASPSADAADGLTDPLDIVTTPGTGASIAEDVQPALHEGGTGPATFEVPQPEAAVGSLQFFVTCATGEYRILVGGVFVYGSGCSPTTANSAAMPIPQRDTPLTVTVEVPESVAFRIVALPV
ncbi:MULTISPECIES: hypothetical protein [Clavibacter]|uniref:Lipoprotein n=2 Tax=Clavibacter TaxID=1573 RepID=A0A399NQ64_9MICO|nr:MULTISPECIES: hypothetical protein [Clavibacter]KDP92204.1 hypothetical protein W824_03415 [Clavibacter cf. michiganensis LMG 26808]RII96104.1 hypothetical protein DZF96_12670 [Clavibacter michiganensis]UKF24982.1 hypothetical protein KYT88_14915 [Clavibacter sp. A6099]